MLTLTEPPTSLVVFTRTTTRVRKPPPTGARPADLAHARIAQHPPRWRPNSGKTRIVLFLIEHLLARFGKAPNTTRILIHDTTGEICAGLPLPDTDFAVVALRGNNAWAWAIGRDIRNLTDATSLSQGLIHSHSWTAPADGHGRGLDHGGPCSTRPPSHQLLVCNLASMRRIRRA
jgi:hypothetical protein